MMQASLTVLWSLMTVLLSYVPDSLVLRAKRALAVRSPAIRRAILALSNWLAPVAELVENKLPEVPIVTPSILRAISRARLSLFQAAREISVRFPCITAIKWRGVNWAYTDDDRVNMTPIVYCPVVDSNGPCICSANVRRFANEHGVECARLGVECFPVFVCQVHWPALAYFPDIAAGVQLSPLDKFTYDHPGHPGFAASI